jgi:hypothetical protein
VLLALVACKDETLEMAKLSDVFPNLPVPPEASVVSREGSPDALMLTFMSNARPAEVEAYYREVLTRNGWRLVGDSRDAEGAVVFLAEQDGPPLWVRIQSTSDSVATMVELAGAVASRKKELKPAS